MFYNRDRQRFTALFTPLLLIVGLGVGCTNSPMGALKTLSPKPSSPNFLKRVVTTTDDDRLYLCSFNAYFPGQWDLRREVPVAQVLAENGCDIIVVQEVAKPPEEHYLRGNPEGFAKFEDMTREEYDAWAAVEKRTTVSSIPFYQGILKFQDKKKYETSDGEVEVFVPIDLNRMKMSKARYLRWASAAGTEASEAIPYKRNMLAYGDVRPLNGELVNFPFYAEYDSENPTTFRFDENNPDPLPDNSTQFFDSLVDWGYDYIISEQDTGSTQHSRATSSEWYVTFFDPAKVKLGDPEKMPWGFLDDTREGEVKKITNLDATPERAWQRTPYAVPFVSADGNFDFVLISVHLHQPSPDWRNRAYELREMAKWADDQADKTGEKDYIILGDTNITTKERLEMILEVVNDGKRNWIALNPNALPTTPKHKGMPYDHIFVNTDYTVVGEELPDEAYLEGEDNFWVFDLSDQACIKEDWESLFPGLPYSKPLEAEYAIISPASSVIRKAEQEILNALGDVAKAEEGIAEGIAGSRSDLNRAEKKVASRRAKIETTLQELTAELEAAGFDESELDSDGVIKRSYVASRRSELARIRFKLKNREGEELSLDPYFMFKTLYSDHNPVMTELWIPTSDDD